MTAKLRTALAWGDVQQVKQVIQTCYVTQSCVDTALLEAALCGSVDTTQILLQAGASPLATIDRQVRGGKTVFHLACQEGHSAVAKLLLAHIRSREAALTTCAQGYTAIETARRNDMNLLANKLQSQLDQQFGT